MDAFRARQGTRAQGTPARAVRAESTPLPPRRGIPVRRSHRLRMRIPPAAGFAADPDQPLTGDDAGPSHPVFDAQCNPFPTPSDTRCAGTFGDQRRRIVDIKSTIACRRFRPTEWRRRLQPRGDRVTIGLHTLCVIRTHSFSRRAGGEIAAFPSDSASVRVSSLNVCATACPHLIFIGLSSIRPTLIAQAP